MQQLTYSLTGIASDVGRVTSMDEWAAAMRIPHRHKQGEVLAGDDVRRILGLQSKCWEPERFARFDTVREVAADALRSANLGANQIDAVFTVTCTPFELMFDQDAFRLVRDLGIPDHVVPVQLGAGCAGLARAGSLAQLTGAGNILLVTYNVPSQFALLEDGSANPIYTRNRTHPDGDVLWVGSALFSDGAAAVVLSRDEESTGLIGYSRDSQSFGGGPGIESPLVSFEGGGAAAPPGTADVVERSCYAMEGEAIKKYYVAGMLLNHAEVCKHQPDYTRTVRRLYTHQASPALVRAFVERAKIPPEWVAVKVETYGNLVSASTLRLVHEDLVDGLTQQGDEICISVVGAGPERGVLSFRLKPREVVAPRPS